HAEFRRPLAVRDHLGIETLVVIDDEAHAGRSRVPAGGAERAEMRASAGLLVDVKGLRIVAPAEALDVVSGEGVLAEFAAVADLHVVEEFHSAASRLRLANMAG